MTESATEGSATLSDAPDADVELSGGAVAAFLRNENGVVIKLLGTSKGRRFKLPADAMNIQLKG